MLLTIGSTNRLHFVHGDGSGIGGGWRTVELSKGLPETAGTDPKVHAISAAWSSDGRTSVAVAV